jgi:uncharacterized protein (DUF58 family)
MIFTRRLFWLLALCGAGVALLVWWLGGGSAGSGLALLIVDGGVLLLAWLDDRRTERTESWQIERYLPPRLVLGEPNAVEIRLIIPPGRALRVQVRDDFPAELDLVGARDLQVWFPPATTSARMASVGYQVEAPGRGEYQFGDLHLRLHSPWGLVLRQSRCPATTVCRVYPNLRQARREELASRRLSSFRMGHQPSYRRGQGRELESLRDYLPGDDIRDIAWAATARRGRLVTRQYRHEHQQRMVLLLDVGRLMTAQIDRLSKLDHAINAALSLARVALASGDQVGLLVFDQEIRAWHPPQRGLAHYQTLLEALYPVQPRLIEPSYQRACGYLSHVNPRRSLVLLMTDLVDEVTSEQLLTATTSLLPRHLPLVVTIGDLHLPSLIADPPTSLAEVYRQSVAEDLLHQRREALARITDRGGLALDLPASHLAPPLIRQYLQIRNRRLL